MLESKSLADYSLNLPHSIEKTAELEQRLGLYQVFLKLYEHHRDLLDEILDLENTDNQQRTRGVWQYVQGVVNEHEVFLTTNLMQEKSQVLRQTQRTWVIGRDRTVVLPIQDKRLSRRHALIQYADGRGFYLLDLNSTNGSYVNGEPVRRSVRLKDGDRIRLGSLSFMFFCCEESNFLTAPPVSEGPVQMLTALAYPTIESSLAHPTDTPTISAPACKPPLCDDSDISLPGSDKETFMFLKSVDEQGNDPDSAASSLSTVQKSEILDRFFNR